ncbi:hypothetical protein GCM10011586_37660 [Silvibacterium dinghuense]|nr:hypothetical protein GCM10011586_37660 [Silvibacterium dinghuense]
MAAGISAAAIRVYRNMQNRNVPQFCRTLAAVVSLASAALLPATLQAQASLKCQVQPQTLAAMHHCYRPLLVFSPRGDNAALRAQIQNLDNDADDMMDRFVLLTPILADSHGYQPPLDSPHALLPGTEMASIRRRFQVPDGTFLVLLLEENGAVALRSSHPVSTDRLNALIDTMPDRKIERQRKDAY